MEDLESVGIGGEDTMTKFVRDEMQGIMNGGLIQQGKQLMERQVICSRFDFCGRLVGR